jgi:hypothetical protein
LQIKATLKKSLNVAKGHAATRLSRKTKGLDRRSCLADMPIETPSASPAWIEQTNKGPA